MTLWAPQACDAESCGRVFVAGDRVVQVGRVDVADVALGDMDTTIEATYHVDCFRAGSVPT